MFAVKSIPILVAFLAAATTQELYVVNEQNFVDCDSAIEYAKSLNRAATVECNLTMQIELDLSQSASSASHSAGNTPARLDKFKEVAEIEFDNPDASGVAFISDDTLVITFQNSLEFRGLDGQLKHTIEPVDGDIEGLEYQAGKFLAVAEQGSTHIDLHLDGDDIVATSQQPLPLRGIECIAFDPATNRTYYGQEFTGVLFDDQFQPVVDFKRDLAGCTVFRGELMALVSHSWRQSVWSRVDLVQRKVIEERLLPAGDWEGVACREDVCVLVRELSEKSKAAMVVFKLDNE